MKLMNQQKRKQQKAKNNQVNQVAKLVKTLKINKQTHPRLRPLDAEGRKIISDEGRKIYTAKPNYKYSLLWPETANGARVPMSGNKTVALRRKITYTLVTNNVGNAAVLLQPAYLSDTSTNLSSFYVNIDNTYTATVSTDATLKSVVPSQGITAGAIQTWRLVSCAIQIVSQSSILNIGGTIHGAIVNMLPAQSVGVGVAAPVGSGAYVLASNMCQETNYKSANVSQTEGLRMIWIPNIPELLEYQAVNTNVYSNQVTATPSAFAVSIMGSAASSPFQVNVYWNYEVVPLPGAILAGLEDYSGEMTDPLKVWADIRVNHEHDIIKAGTSIGALAAGGSYIDRAKQISAPRYDGPETVKMIIPGGFRGGR